MPELHGADVPLHHLERLDPLLDSADMGPRDWVRIARAILERDRDFDGFVVLHGTDTLVYTASALSFLLTGLRKPIVVTGSQLSLEHVRSDGREHIITSLIIAGTMPIPEVCIYFASKLLRGNRTQKIHNSDFVAFGSGNRHRSRRSGSASPCTITSCASRARVCPRASSSCVSPTSARCGCSPASAEP